MAWQRFFQQYCSEEHPNVPKTAREAVKECLRSYVELDWKLESIVGISRISDYSWEAQIGGVVQTERGERQELRREQIAITRLGNSPCCAVFELAEIIAE